MRGIKAVLSLLTPGRSARLPPAACPSVPAPWLFGNTAVKPHLQPALLPTFPICSQQPPVPSLLPLRQRRVPWWCHPDPLPLPDPALPASARQFLCWDPKLHRFKHTLDPLWWDTAENIETIPGVRQPTGTRYVLQATVLEAGKGISRRGPSSSQTACSGMHSTCSNGECSHPSVEPLIGGQTTRKGF